MGKLKSKGKVGHSEPPRSSAKATVDRLFRSSSIRNKLRRQAVFQQEKAQKIREKRERRQQRKKEREELGDEVGELWLITHVLLTPITFSFIYPL